MRFKRGDVVHIRKYWANTIGIVMDYTTKTQIVSVDACLGESAYGIGGFHPRELELLGHIDLEEGEKQCQSTIS